MKHLAILAVLSVVIQTPATVLGQSTNSTVQASSGVSLKDQSKSNNAPESPIPGYADSGAGPKDQRWRGTQSSNDTGQTVSVTKLPPVSVSKDWSDWGVWGFSGFLAIVGGLQAWFLYKTLRAIKRQVDIMEQGLDRPWIVARVESPPSENPLLVSVARVPVHFKNVGKAIAFLIEIRARIDVLEGNQSLLLPPPDYEAIEGRTWGDHGAIFVPTAETGWTSELPVNPNVLYSGNHTLWVHGRIKYKDAHGREHETRYCYRWAPIGTDYTLSRFYMDGPSEYNRAT